MLRGCKFSYSKYAGYALVTSSSLVLIALLLLVGFNLLDLFGNRWQVARQTGDQVSSLTVFNKCAQNSLKPPPSKVEASLSIPLIACSEDPGISVVSTLAPALALTPAPAAVPASVPTLGLATTATPPTDTIAALSLLAAAVTILLSLGSTWFNKEAARLDVKSRKIDAKLDEINLELKLFDTERQLSTGISTALAQTSALRVFLPQVLYLAFKGQTREPAMRAIYLSWEFAGLESPAAEQRFAAFGYIVDALGFFETDWPAELVNYTEACVALARLRDPLLNQADRWTWCRLHSADERLAHQAKVNLGAAARV